MNALSLQVYSDYTKADMIADWTCTAQGVVFETDDHGYANLKAFIPMSSIEAFRIFDLLPSAHILLNAYGFHAFEGRIEDRELTNDGIKITAYGYFRAFSDMPFTGFWSTTQYNDWQQTTEDQSSTRKPAKFNMDQRDRLYISLKRNETYGDNAAFGEWYWLAPWLGNQDIVEIEFNYDYTLPNNWRWRVVSREEDFSGGNVDAYTDGDGSNHTGGPTIVTLTSDKEMVAFDISYQAGSGTFTNNLAHDAWYLKITDIHVRGTANDTVYADEVMQGFVNYVYSVNPGQISQDYSLIESPGVEIWEAIWEDASMPKIMEQLSVVGDSETPPQKYEYGVWEGQKFYFRPKGSAARTWYIDAGDIRINSTLDNLYNGVYGFYTDTSKFKRRTTTATDAASIAKYGLTRVEYIKTTTTDQSEAQNWRDTKLEEDKIIRPETKFTVNTIYGESGQPIPIWLPRAGDEIVVRNLPPTAGSEIDKIRRFYCTRTSCDLDKGELTITPEEPISSVDIMLAKHEIAIAHG